MNAVVRGFTRFSRWTEARFADHRLLGSLAMAGAVGLSLVLINNGVTPFAGFLAVGMGANTWWAWGPRGRARLRHEQRLEDDA